MYRLIIVLITRSTPVVHVKGNNICSIKEIKSKINKLKTYAGLDYCFVHHTNVIEVILHLMVTVNNIMQLFVHRRLPSKKVKEIPEKELIRLIRKDMYTYKEN